jgi:hypothetical protein
MRLVDDAAWRSEGKRFGKYLIGREPTPVDVDRYVSAMAGFRAVPTGRDRRRLSFVAAHPAWLSIVDAGLGLRDPGSSLRWRLLVMTSILEATPEHAGEFLPVVRPRRYALYVALIAARAAVRGAIGIVVVTLIR